MSSRNCTTADDFAHTVNLDSSITGTFICCWIVFSNIGVMSYLIHSLCKNKVFNVPKLLMIGVCSTDLGYGLFSTFPQVFIYWFGYCATGGWPTCVYKGYISNFLLVASQLMVLIMTLERFCALKMPFRYHTIVTMKTTGISLIIVYLYATFIACFPLFGVNHYGFRGWCGFHWNDQSAVGASYVYFIVVQGLIIMAVLLACNFIVIKELIKMQKKQPGGPGASSGDSKQTEFIIVMSGVSVSFIICCTPFLVRVLANQIGVGVSGYADFVAMRMYMINNMTNAHLYWFLRLLARINSRSLKRICFCFVKSKNIVEPLSSDFKTKTLTDETNITPPASMF